MGKIIQAMLAFIDEIPDSKFEGHIRSYTVHTDHKNFRLNNQGTTTAKDGKPVCYNIQLQYNHHRKTTSRAVVKQVVGHIEMPVHDPWPAAVIKERLKESVIVFLEKKRTF